MSNRRDFIKTTSAGLTGVVLSSATAGSILSSEEKNLRPIHVFTKCLQFLDYQQMAELLAKNGFDGADLAVRPRGQVLPENVERDLPKAVKALKSAGIGTNMIVTGLSNPNDPAFRPTLKTMANLGIQYYRMGYINFDDNKSIPDNLELHKETFKKIEKLNKEFGVTGNYQNHSGRRVGGPVWDLYHLLQDCDPDFIGVQYDVRHATVEGGMSWPLGMKLLSPWIKTTDIKDFIWEKDEKGQWKLKNVPLGEGMVDFETYFKLYKAFNIEAPVSIHYEYDLGGAEHGDTEITMSIGEIEKFLKKDLEFLKMQFAKFEIK